MLEKHHRRLLRKLGVEVLDQIGHLISKSCAERGNDFKFDALQKNAQYSLSSLQSTQDLWESHVGRNSSVNHVLLVRRDMLQPLVIKHLEWFEVLCFKISDCLPGNEYPTVSN